MTGPFLFSFLFSFSFSGSLCGFGKLKPSSNVDYEQQSEYERLLTASRNLPSNFRWALAAWEGSGPYSNTIHTHTNRHTHWNFRWALAAQFALHWNNINININIWKSLWVNLIFLWLYYLRNFWCEYSKHDKCSQWCALLYICSHCSLADG